MFSTFKLSDLKTQAKTLNDKYESTQEGEDFNVWENCECLPHGWKLKTRNSFWFKVIIVPFMQGIIMILIFLILGGGVFLVSNLDYWPTQKIPPPKGVFTVWISFVATPEGGHISWEGGRYSEEGTGTQGECTALPAGYTPRNDSKLM